MDASTQLRLRAARMMGMRTRRDWLAPALAGAGLALGIAVVVWLRIGSGRSLAKAVAGSATPKQDGAARPGNGHGGHAVKA